MSEARARTLRPVDPGAGAAPRRRPRQSAPQLRVRSVWEGGGCETGPQVVAFGAAVTLSVIVVDLALVGRVSMFFDLWFVLLSITLALQVRAGEFFTVGVLPPLIMLGAFVILGLSRPGVIADPGDGVVQAVVTGLARHSVALVAGYGLCLATLLARQRLSD